MRHVGKLDHRCAGGADFLCQPAPQIVGPLTVENAPRLRCVLPPIRVCGLSGKGRTGCCISALMLDYTPLPKRHARRGPCVPYVCVNSIFQTIPQRIDQMTVLCVRSHLVGLDRLAQVHASTVDKESPAQHAAV